MKNLVVVPVILRTDLPGSLHFHLHLREMLIQQRVSYSFALETYFEVSKLSIL
jgi:hypothetical protein